MRVLILLLSLCLLAPSAFAAKPLRLSDRQAVQSVTPWLEYAEDPHSDVSPTAILGGTSGLKWQKTRKRVLSLGFSSSSWWIRVKVKNRSIERDRWLVIGYPLLNDITLYQVRDGKVMKTLKGGTLRPAPDDAVRSHQLLFPMQFAADTTDTLLLRVKSESSLLLPISLQTPAALIGNNSEHLTWLGIVLGFLTGLMVYHLIMLFNFRDRSYSLLLAVLVALISCTALLNGIVDRYVITLENYLPAKLIPITISAAGGLVLMLTRTFLSTATTMPRADRWLFVAVCISVFSGVMALIGDYHTGILVTVPTIPATILGGLMVSITSRNRGYRPATLLFAGWMMLVVGVFTYALRAAGIVPENGLTDNSLQLSLMVYVLFVAFALTDRLRLLDETATQATRDLAEHIQQQNARLEADVDARTHVLADETAQLASARHTLMFQNRRLASGVMSAGIAHEINNPNNFINGGIQTFLSRLDAFAETMDELLDDTAPEAVRAGLAGRLAQLRSSAFRIAENSAEISLVVQRFRNVSNGDESDILITDIVTRIENALLTMRSSLADKVDIRTDFNVRHEVKCRPMESAHAFTDILRNLSLQARAQGEIRADSKIQSGRLILSLRTNYPFRLNDEIRTRSEAVMASQRGEFKQVNDRTLLFLFPLR